MWDGSCSTSGGQGFTEENPGEDGRAEERTGVHGGCHLTKKGRGRETDEKKNFFSCESAGRGLA